MGPLNILILGSRPRGSGWADNIDDHQASFGRHSRHNIFYFNEIGFLDYGLLPSHLELNRFDVLVVHHSVPAFSEEHLNHVSRHFIREFRGLKVCFRQDEFQYVEDMVELLRYWEIDVLYTVIHDDPVIERFYPKKDLPKLCIEKTLTGFVPERWLQPSAPRIHERTIDVGYRGRKNGYWMGGLGVEKWEIVPKFLKAVEGSGLNCDLSYSEKDRIYGDAWTKFLTSCRTVLGTESGASSADFSGNLRPQLDEYQRLVPDASFEEVCRRFLKEDWKFPVRAISPRCFEAAATKTPMILYEGEYSGVLKPGAHFIPLKKDYSNIKEIIRLVRDDAYLQEMADRTFEEVALNPANSYKRFVANFDEVVTREFSLRGYKRASHPYVRLEFLRKVQLGLRKTKAKKRIREAALSAWYAIPEEKRKVVKSYLKSPLGLLR